MDGLLLTPADADAQSQLQLAKGHARGILADRRIQRRLVAWGYSIPQCAAFALFCGLTSFPEQEPPQLAHIAEISRCQPGDSWILQVRLTQSLRQSQDAKILRGRPLFMAPVLEQLEITHMHL